MEGLNEFFFDRVNTYEEQMQAAFEASSNLEELNKHHLEKKADVLAKLPATWRSAFESTEFPSNVLDSVSKMIDESYSHLEQYFQPQGDHQATKDANKKEILSQYVTEMDKFLETSPSATKEELAKQHKKISRRSLSIVPKQNATVLNKLEYAFEEKYQEFLEKLEHPATTVSNVAIGIDLGTTMCCVMVVNSKGVPEIVPNKTQGDSVTTPSYVAYHEDGFDTFGEIAKKFAYKFPEVTIYDAKRMIGRPFTDKTLQHDSKSWPFKVVNDNGNPKICTWNRTRYPHEVSARLLAHFRVMTEQHLKAPRGTIRKAVVTVPAYFTETQRRATYEAALCAGLDVLNILSEPTAAAIAYSYQRRFKGDRTALIYDLGGGTFDVAIAKVSEDNVDILVVDGDTHLGGQDVDNILVDYCTEIFKRMTDCDLNLGKSSDVKQIRDDALRALFRIKLQCEKAKMNLSSAPTADIYIENLVGELTLDVQISREILNELCQHLVQKTIEIVDRAVKEAINSGKIESKEEVDDVILVGGSTRLLLVQKLLSEYFNGKQLCLSINPDEAVAYGAAVQASMLANKQENIKVQDVLPMSLGIKKKGNVLSVIIPKNTKIPCEGHEIYTTSKDNVTSFRVKIFQGENPVAKKNKFLGDFLLEGFPARPKGEEKAKVTMKFDSKGMLHVEAYSLTTQNANSLIITSDRLGMDMATMKELRKKLDNIPVPKPRTRKSSTNK